MQQLTFEYPAYFFLFVIIAAIGLSIALYWRTATFTEGPKYLKIILGSLRFLAIFLILALLIGPVLRTAEESVEKPIIAVAQDVSTSIKDYTDSLDLAEYISELEQLKERLSNQFEVKVFSFGGDFSSEPDWTFPAKKTNLSENLQNIYDLYDNRNLGAVILASDGLYNEGSNPLYMGQLREAPVHTITLGDTTINKDLAIKNVLANDIALLGDEFYLQVDVEATFLEGESSKLLVHQLKDGRETKQAEVDLDLLSTDYFKTEKILLKADEAGMQRFVIEVLPLSDEKNTANNRREIFVDVIDSRKNILLLAAAPHPDLTAIRQSLAQNENYKLEIRFPDELEEINWEPIDLIILHQISNPNQSLQDIPVLHIIGSATDLNSFNNQQSALNIQSGISGQNEVLVNLNPSFNLFNIEEEWKTILPLFPPLKTPFANFEIAPDAQVWWYQTIGKIQTKYPLLLFQDREVTKTGVLLGEGIWKWRLYDYLNNDTHENFDGLFGKIIQYLSVIEDKRRLQVNLPNRIIDDNQSVTLEAILYNKSFEPINTEDVFLKLIDSKGNELEFLFTPMEEAISYKLDAGILPAGDYRYLARSSFGGDQLSTEGKFSVQSIEVENYSTQADVDLLKKISNESGGQNYNTTDLSKLTDDLLNSSEYTPVIYENSMTMSAINIKWLLFLIVGLLAIEWFLRRYFGSY